MQCYFIKHANVTWRGFLKKKILWKFCVKKVMSFAEEMLSKERWVISLISSSVSPRPSISAPRSSIPSRPSGPPRSSRSAVTSRSSRPVVSWTVMMMPPEGNDKEVNDREQEDADDEEHEEDHAQTPSVGADPRPGSKRTRISQNLLILHCLMWSLWDQAHLPSCSIIWWFLSTTF